MQRIEHIEASRLKVQRHLDSAKTQAERNKLGQFATPGALANEILEYARKILPSRMKIRFLDPAFGTGSFYSALLKTFARTRIEAAYGFEIDERVADSASDLWGNRLLQLKQGDFTKQTLQSREKQKANLLICNPPYVRHHHLSSADKSRLNVIVRQSLGINLSGLSGFYCYFMCIAHSWMAEDGLAAWLIPSEFMDVNYGRAIKDYLLNHVTLLRIHRFDPSDVQFDDALVSSAVVWFKKTKPHAHHNVEFSFGGSLLSPATTTNVPGAVLRHAGKWTQFPQNSHPKETHDGLKLSNLFTIKRGIATGANSFFILTPEKVEELKLPKEFLIPILPSPRHLITDEILAGPHGDPLVERRQYLLSCKLPESEVKANYPSLWKYLESGKLEGVDTRYLSQHRSPWYSQEERQPPLFLCTYINRKSKANGETFRFILNHSRAIAANVYLLLYPKEELATAFKEAPALVQSVWEMLKSLKPEEMRDQGRVYGGELYKIEPRELGNVSAEIIVSAMPGVFAKARAQASFW
jgi:adenine-specific DNA-methyltransferase